MRNTHSLRLSLTTVSIRSHNSMKILLRNTGQLVGEIVRDLTINNDSEIYDLKYKRPSKLKYINKYGKQAIMETKAIGGTETH